MAKTQTIENYLRTLDGPVLETVAVLRKIFAETSTDLAEQIKWNSISFYYTGPMKAFDPKEYKRDIVVFNLYKKEAVRLIFPTGTRLKDPDSVLEGSYTDGRRLLTIKDAATAKKLSGAIRQLVLNWIETVDAA